MILDVPSTTLVTPYGTIALYKMDERGQFKEKSRKKALENIYIVMQDVSPIANSIEPGHVKPCLMSIATNKGADQPAHLLSLISIFLFAALIAKYLLILKLA